MEASMHTKLLKAIADDTRLRILRLLILKPFCVTEIMTLLDLTQTNTSKQLSKLKSVGIIETRRKDGYTYYQWSGDFQKNEPEWTKAIQNMLNDSPDYPEDQARTRTYLKGNYCCKDLQVDDTLIMQLNKI